MDKYSGWLSIFHFAKDTANNVIKAIKDYFSTFGVSEIICSDGAKVFVSTEVQEFLKTWGVTHKVSSAYHSSSNKRAEVAVKSAKRLIRENVGPNGCLQTGKMLKALLAHRNTPDTTTSLSPAAIVFGRDLRDHILRKTYPPNGTWIEVAKKQEEAFL